MRPFLLRVLYVTLSLIVFVNPARSQVVKLNETALTPYKSAPAEAGRQNLAPAAYFYVAVRPGPTGALDSSSDKEAAINLLKSSGFVYPSLDFVFSAASQLIADGSAANNAGSATKALAEVSRINAHVRIEPLDGERNPIKMKDTAPPLLVLTIAPEEVAFAQNNSPDKVAEIETGVQFASQFMGPLGGLVSAFQSSHKAPRAPTQIAYQSSDNEFGWTWYQSPDTPIEGLHRCGALLEVPANVAFLHIAVDLITDWRRFGAWKKSFDFRVPVASAR